MDNYYILLDTDIGGDIDDALALAYLLSKSNSHLKGITVVGGNLDSRAKIANAICRVSGKETPIYKGLDPKLPNDWYPTPVGEAKLSLWPHSEIYEGNFVDFMYSVIKENPYTITIIAIGQLSNIGKLLEIYPNVTTLIKEIRIMGGVFDKELNSSTEMPFINWNVWSDPIAAKRVFESDIQSIKVYGYEITKNLTIETNELLKKANTNLLKCATSFGEDWISKNNPMFHDPLPAVALFDDSICEYKKGRITVNLDVKQDSPLYGETIFTPDESGNLEICTKVDNKRFFVNFFEFLSDPISSKNLFMFCNKVNESAYFNLPTDYTIRTLRESELELWKRFPFDTEEEYLNYEDFMNEYYEKNYSARKEEFFKRCKVICFNDVPIATGFIWKQYGKYTTVHWLKVKKEYEGKGIGRALLTHLLKGVKDEDYPIFLHTQPESFKAIKLYTDFGFSLISSPKVIDNRSNDLLECVPLLKESMNGIDFNNLKTIDLSNMKEIE